MKPSRQAPWADIWIAGGLLSERPFAPTAERSRREAALRSFIGRRNVQWILLGDLRKGGREATPEELLRLQGRLPDGVPRGLTRCACGELRGECLDPSPRLQGLEARVHCRCENDSFCARCGLPLAHRKIAANHYRPDDGQVWHLPGFAALRHAADCRQREATDLALTGSSTSVQIHADGN